MKPAVPASMPQLPDPMPVVKFSLFGFGVKPQQGPPPVVVVVVVDTDVVVVVEATPMQSAATSPSAFVSICVQVCVCTEQSAALVALEHEAVNLSVHFCSLVGSGGVSFA